MAGLSTYAQDKVEIINLANGNLAMQFPLVTVGGRGTAAYTIALAYNSKLWTAETDIQLIVEDLDRRIIVRFPHYSAVYDDGTMSR